MSYGMSLFSSISGSRGRVEDKLGDSLSECRPTGMVEGRDHEIAPKLDSTEIGKCNRGITVVESLSAGNES